MRIFKRIHGKERPVAIALAAAFLGLIAGPALASAGEDESDICERAFTLCFGAALSGASGSFDMKLFLSLQFCAVGYSFCERYVEAILERR